jgi:hypothetical protein
VNPEKILERCRIMYAQAEQKGRTKDAEALGCVIAMMERGIKVSQEKPVEKVAGFKSQSQIG